MPLRIETNSTWPPLKELRGFCSAARPVTGITGAHNGQIVQDSSSGHARRTCLKPELSSSEMVSLLRAIIDHLTTWEPAVLPGENLAIVLRMLAIILNKREQPQQPFLTSANQHQALHWRGKGSLSVPGPCPFQAQRRHCQPGAGSHSKAGDRQARTEPDPHALSLMQHLMERGSQIPTSRIRAGSGAEAPGLQVMLLSKPSTYLAPGNTAGEKLFPRIPSQENPLPNADPLCHSPPRARPIHTKPNSVLLQALEPTRTSAPRVTGRVYKTSLTALCS